MLYSILLYDPRRHMVVFVMIDIDCDICCVQSWFVGRIITVLRATDTLPVSRSWSVNLLLLLHYHNWWLYLKFVVRLCKDAHHCVSTRKWLLITITTSTIGILTGQFLQLGCIHNGTNQSQSPSTGYSKHKFACIPVAAVHSNTSLVQIMCELHEKFLCEFCFQQSKQQNGRPYRYLYSDLDSYQCECGLNLGNRCTCSMMIYKVDVHQ